MSQINNKLLTTTKEKFSLPIHLIIDGLDKPIAEISPDPLPYLCPIESEISKNPVDSGLDRIAVHPPDQPFVLDQAKPLDPFTFPNPARAGHSQIPATIPNINHLLVSYGILVRYNVTKKKLTITMPGYAGCPDNTDNVALTQIMSLATLNGLPIGQIPSIVEAVGDRNQFNPVASWITSKPWDRVDRLQSIYDTLIEREDFPKKLKETLMYRWLLSAVAAALMPIGFKSRGVLTMQGQQSLGKTAWVNSLVSNAMLRSEVVLLNHQLDASNKDTLLSAIAHWFVEIGELDGTFKKDIARLKGFITMDRDKVRRPYGRMDSEYPRRTVFCATVNDSNFLIDHTGNSRWWTIPVTKINYQHGIDMQQLFAQLVVDYENDNQWWLTAAEEQSLEFYNKKHRTVSALYERLLDAVDLETMNDTLPAMTPTEVLRVIGIQNPTNPQTKECAGFLREHFGESKRINGRDKWRVPMRGRTQSLFPLANIDDDY